MADDLKIEKNIPIPPRKREIRKGYVWTLRQMKVGDSALFPTAKKASGAIVEMKRRGDKAKFTYRTVEGGARVWRIK